MFSYSEVITKECKEEAKLWRPRISSDRAPFVNRTPIINKQTPIGAAGSCFAMEISEFLKKNKYNYVLTEENIHSSAAWGVLYNTPSFRQLVEFAFGHRDRPNIIFECEDKTNEQQKYWDPFRECIYFKSVEEYEDSVEKHRQGAKQALLESKVFIMTVGLTEVWRLAYDNSVLARFPRSSASHLVYKQVLSVEENINELQRMLDILRVHNPGIKIIITVSPVPLYATFRAEESHVVTATYYSKSVLRAAVQEFVDRNPGVVFYFPAFEVVTYCAPKPWDEDCRHVTREAVSQVMELFEKTFLET